MFKANFEYRPYIWTTKSDEDDPYGKRNVYITSKLPMKLFNLSTREGALHFEKRMSDIGHEDIITEFKAKIKNRDAYEKGETPFYASEHDVDHALAKALSDTSTLHGMDGWRLKLGKSNYPEFLFVNPGEKFTIEQKRRRS